MVKPKRMTTKELRDMISKGATRNQLPTKTKGDSIISTKESAQTAYLKAVNRAKVTAQFRAAQQIKKTKKSLD